MTVRGVAGKRISWGWGFCYCKHSLIGAAIFALPRVGVQTKLLQDVATIGFVVVVAHAIFLWGIVRTGKQMVKIEEYVIIVRVKVF